MFFIVFCLSLAFFLTLMELPLWKVCFVYILNETFTMVSCHQTLFEEYQSKSQTPLIEIGARRILCFGEKFLPKETLPKLAAFFEYINSEFQFSA